MGQLDYGVVALIAIADKRQGKFAVGIVMLSHKLHSQRITIKPQAFIEIVYPNHGVQKAHSILLNIQDQDFKWRPSRMLAPTRGSSSGRTVTLLNFPLRSQLVNHAPCRYS
jgi:hypothetical protein